ncbi:MAG: FHA domain-containing protein [Clostridia bacterium]|nr:FHA domain-containing protein [Clostridia bacterium]MBQ4158993.1 FHA domain-containing protein [Clostridia bacterium]
MKTRKLAQRIAAFAVMALLVLLSAFAYAVETEEYGAKFMVNDDPSIIDVDIINFKVKLRDLGFYSAGVAQDTLQTRKLDDLTMAAVKLVCTLNPEFSYYDDGVSNELFWRVMGIVPGELITPLGEVYEPITLGQMSDQITKVQNRLNTLGYDKCNFVFTPGVYDDQLQGAIDEFVRCNKFVYEAGSGITKEMQELMFSEQAAAYFADADPDKSFSEKMLDFFKRKSNIFGMKLPNAVLFVIGFVLVGVIVVLVWMLVAPKKSGGKSGAGDATFIVEYGNDKTTYRTNVMRNYVRIGRATGEFPLNMSDESISRKHCEICYEGGNYMLRDFSSYGTLVNGSMCHHTQQALNSGDIIEIGKHRITINF